MSRSRLLRLLPLLLLACSGCTAPKHSVGYSAAPRGWRANPDSEDHSFFYGSFFGDGR